MKRAATYQVPLKNKRTVYKKIPLTNEWKKCNLLHNKLLTQFSGEIHIPEDVKNLDSPNDFFSYFFDDNLCSLIIQQSQLYSVEINPSKPLTLSKTEFKRFIGIIIMMSIVHVPNSRSYWSDNIGNCVIKDCMSINVFENIKRFLHFNDNSLALPRNHENHDRLQKIRPLVDCLKQKFCSLPFEENLSLDEQLCPTKARSYLKQYLPLKPHKWGYKLFVLCGVSGYAYNFEIYTGNENDANERLNYDEPDLGATSNVVVRLSRVIPTNKNHKLFFDNYYTSLPVMVYLKKKGIDTVGTFRRNRFPNLKFMSEKEIMKKPRGTSEECITVIDDVPITAVQWRDNKIVNIASTFVGELEKNIVKRFDKKLNKKIEVSRPNIIQMYNSNMGGVDLIDSMIARYRIIMRTKKWYIKIFYHLLDMTVVNSWLLYKKVKNQNITLAAFREQLSVSLCRGGLYTRQVRGRRSNDSIELQKDIENLRALKRTPTGSMPPIDIIKDNISHWEIHTKLRRICKMPNCKFQSYIRCSKCNVYLCSNYERNCFYKFHN